MPPDVCALSFPECPQTQSDDTSPEDLSSPDPEEISQAGLGSVEGGPTAIAATALTALFLYRITQGTASHPFLPESLSLRNMGTNVSNTSPASPVPLMRTPLGGLTYTLGATLALTTLPGFLEDHGVPESLSYLGPTAGVLGLNRLVFGEFGFNSIGQSMGIYYFTFLATGHFLEDQFDNESSEDWEFLSPRNVVASALVAATTTRVGIMTLRQTTQTAATEILAAGTTNQTLPLPWRLANRIVLANIVASVGIWGGREAHDWLYEDDPMASADYRLFNLCHDLLVYGDDPGLSEGFTGPFITTYEASLGRLPFLSGDHDEAVERCMQEVAANTEDFAAIMNDTLVNLAAQSLYLYDSETGERFRDENTFYLSHAGEAYTPDHPLVWRMDWEALDEDWETLRETVPDFTENLRAHLEEIRELTFGISETARYLSLILDDEGRLYNNFVVGQHIFGQILERQESWERNIRNQVPDLSPQEVENIVSQTLDALDEALLEPVRENERRFFQ